MNLPGLDLPILSFTAPAPSDDHTAATSEDAAGSAEERVSVSLDHLITSRLLIQGSSGAGKGWAIRTLLEGTQGWVQQIVLDKEGEFSTLREKFDYILAGAEGDVPADPQSAALLCRRLMDLGASAVVDLYDLPNAEKRRFVKNFLTALMALPKELWRPLLVVIDEAHFFVPEGAPCESSEAVISLCSEGRKRGFCAVLATQRLSKLNKDAAAELRNKLIGLTSLDVDVRRAADDLGFTKDEGARLKRLQAGQFFAVGPALCREVTLIRTGAVLTTHPKAGEIAAYTPPPPAEAIQALLAQLRDLPQQAEDEAHTADELRDQNADLRRKLAEKSAGSDASVRERIVEVEKIVEVPVFREGEIERALTLTDDMAALGKDLVAVGKTLLSSSQEIRAKLTTTPQPPMKSLIIAAEDQEAPAALESPKTVGNAAKTVPISPKTVGSAVTRPQQVILNTLAGLAALGLSQPQRVHVALFAGVSPSSSAFTNNLGALRTAGYLDYPAGGLVSLTHKGQQAGQSSDRRLTVRELQTAWLARLTAPQRRIVEALLACYPGAMTRDVLAQYAEASSTSSAFTNNLGSLRTLGLVSYPEKGQVAATALLFPEGLPR